jgi:hypothetical protein
MMERFKQRQTQMQQQQVQQPVNPNMEGQQVVNSNKAGSKLTFDQRLSSLENKLDKIINALGV